MRLLAAALIVASGIGAPDSPRLVTIDVTVTDARGRALTDLKPTDFELREGGTVLPLESVRLVRATAAPARGERQPRVRPTASTMVSASTDSTAEPRKAAPKIKRSVTTPSMVRAFRRVLHGTLG